MSSFAWGRCGIERLSAIEMVMDVGVSGGGRTVVDTKVRLARGMA
jgi:hypothetical protein